MVNKVAGNIQLGPGRAYKNALLHDQYDWIKQGYTFDVSHTIHKLQFGDDYPGIENPLDNTLRTYTPSSSSSSSHSSTAVSVDSTNNGAVMQLYYVKVVPTTYDVKGDQVVTNQYSVTEHIRRLTPDTHEPHSAKAMANRVATTKSNTVTTKKAHKDGTGKKPCVYFFYELSPIMVKVSEKRKPFLHFITQLCAIVGGVFTVAGLVDKFVYGALKHVQKKVELGKFS